MMYVVTIEKKYTTGSAGMHPTSLYPGESNHRANIPSLEEDLKSNPLNVPLHWHPEQTRHLRNPKSLGISRCLMHEYAYI